MAHQIAKKKNGGDAFVSVKEKPWHGLGTIVEGKMNSEECIKLAGLDYQVEKTAAFAKIDGKFVPIKGTNATYRTDNNEVFGSVGDRYTIVQNEEAFTFFDAIVGEKAAIYETAGALFGGAKVFITAKLPAEIKVGKDVIDQYLFLTSTHDGSGAIKAAFTPVRIVCNNTLHAALKKSTRMVSIRHTLKASEQLSQAHKLMGIVAKEAEFMEEALTHMAKFKITDEQLLSFIRAAMHPKREQILRKQFHEEFSVRFENIVGEIAGYAHTHPTQQTRETAGTLYGAYNAISGYYSNVREYESKESRLVTNIYGQGQKKTAHAMGLALAVMTNKFQLQ